MNNNEHSVSMEILGQKISYPRDIYGTIATIVFFSSLLIAYYLSLMNSDKVNSLMNSYSENLKGDNKVVENTTKLTTQLKDYQIIVQELLERANLTKEEENNYAKKLYKLGMDRDNIFYSFRNVIEKKKESIEKLKKTDDQRINNIIKDQESLLKSQEFLLDYMSGSPFSNPAYGQLIFRGEDNIKSYFGNVKLIRNKSYELKKDAFFEDIPTPNPVCIMGERRFFQKQAGEEVKIVDFSDQEDSTYYIIIEKTRTKELDHK